MCRDASYLYAVETKYLRVNPKIDALAGMRASENVRNLGQRGGNANGFARDDKGNAYMLMREHNAIYVYKYAFPSPFNSSSRASLTVISSKVQRYFR